jgi:hypothetical protein
MIRMMSITIHPAMTNAERQRNFRESHPGYYARIQRSKRALEKLAAEQYLASLRAAAAEAADATPGPPEIDDDLPAPTAC